MPFGNLFSNIRQKRVDQGLPLLFPGVGKRPDPTPGSAGARPQELADELRGREDQRQQDILAGRDAINNAFSRFNDDYYNTFAADYTSHYYPQIDRQYDRAQGQTRASLADRGVGQSSIAGHAFADLLKTRLDARNQVAAGAVDAANALRSNVENTRTNLFGLNEAAADPAALNTQAQAQATALVAPPTTNPLGQIFASTLGPLTAGIQSYQNRFRPEDQYRQSYNRAPPRSSATVVN